MSKLFLKALNKSQLLLLRFISDNENERANRIVSRLNATLKVPPSTAKLNMKILRDLGLVSYGKGKPVKLTRIGRFVLELIEYWEEVASENAKSYLGVKAPRFLEEKSYVNGEADILAKRG